MQSLMMKRQHTKPRGNERATVKMNRTTAAAWPKMRLSSYSLIDSGFVR